MRFIDYSTRTCPSTPIQSFEVMINSMSIVGNCGTDPFSLDAVEAVLKQAAVDLGLATIDYGTYSLSLYEPVCWSVTGTNYTKGSCSTTCCKTTYALLKTKTGQVSITDATHSSDGTVCAPSGNNCTTNLCNGQYVPTSPPFLLLGGMNCYEDCFWKIDGNNDADKSYFLGTNNITPLNIGSNHVTTITCGLDAGGHGEIGINNTNPSDALTIGSKLNFHVGANNNYIAFNDYVDGSNHRLRMARGGDAWDNEYSGALYFDSRQDGASGLISLGTAGIGPVGETLYDGLNINLYNETNSGFKGLTIIPTTDNLHGLIGLGTYPWNQTTRVLIHGLTTGSTTAALQVTSNNLANTLLFVRDDGNVGIGTTSPQNLLQIGDRMGIGTGAIWYNTYIDAISGTTKNIFPNHPSVQFGWDGGSGTGAGFTMLFDVQPANTALFDWNSGYIMKGFRFSNSGNMGIGEYNPTAVLEVKGIDNLSGNSVFRATNQNENDLFIIRNNGNVGIGFSSPGHKLDVNGKVRIGTNQIASTSAYYTEYMLSVDGTVVASKIVVSASDWADIVFGKGYNLMPLHDLGDYIAKYNKLPDIPSENEVKENGIDLAKLNTNLLKKIEELTLYTLAINKRNELLQKEIDELKNKIDNK